MSGETLSSINVAAIALALSIGATSLPAFAAGGSGGSGGAAPIVCRDGFAYSEEKKICVPEDELDDAMLYEQGHALALAGYYGPALDVLGGIRDKNDAMVLTMIGYATRKLGNTEEGIAIYRQALAIDPDNVNTHEYLGEGYLAAGRVDLAELELDTLERLCGTTCEQYQDLAKALAGDPVWN